MFKKSFILFIALLISLSSAVSANTSQDDSGHDDIPETILGYTNPDEAPPIPIVSFYPDPITFFSVETKNSKQAILKLTTSENVTLSIKFSGTNKKDGTQTFEKKNGTNFENIKIPLIDTSNSINIHLENENYSFDTVIQIANGKVENSITRNSEYKLVNKQSFSTASVNYEVEPNDSMGLADNTYSNDDNYGIFPSTTDNTDYWKFTLSTRAYANFFLGNIPSGSDYDIFVYNSSGSEVARSTNGSNTSETVLYKDLSAGTYYVKVYRYSDGVASSNYFMRWRISKMWPVNWSTNMSRGFIAGSHYGIDITSISNTKMTTTGCHLNNGCYKGEPIAAMHDGTVSLSSTSILGYGYAVYINHVINGSNVQTRYGHLYSIESGIYSGATVIAGQQIGYMGNRGDVFGTTGLHLHFATVNCAGSCSNVTDNTKMVDPLTNYLPGY